MRDILYPDHAPSDPNPMKRAQNAMQRHLLPKRFYKEATVVEAADGFQLLLDGRAAKTPGRNALLLPSPAAVQMIAAEWNGVTDVIDPSRMHATRLANTAIDSFGDRIAEVQADIAGYAASDLVCYRAGEPEGLVARQTAAWDPVIAWAEGRLNVRFLLAEGIVHQAQGEATLAAVSAAVQQVTQPIALACLHVMTTITGSCLIALMVAERALDPESAWQASIVDEDWNASLWGRDEDAERRLSARREEFLAACGLYLSIC